MNIEEKFEVAYQKYINYLYHQKCDYILQINLIENELDKATLSIEYITKELYDSFHKLQNSFSEFKIIKSKYDQIIEDSQETDCEDDKVDEVVIYEENPIFQEYYSLCYALDKAKENYENCVCKREEIINKEIPKNKERLNARDILFRDLNVVEEKIEDVTNNKNKFKIFKFWKKLKYGEENLNIHNFDFQFITQRKRKRLPRILKNILN